MGLIEFLLFVAAGYIVLTALVFVGYSALYGASAAEVRAARERIAAPRQGQPPLALDEEIKAAGALYQGRSPRQAADLDREERTASRQPPSCTIEEWRLLGWARAWYKSAVQEKARVGARAQVVNKEYGNADAPRSEEDFRPAICACAGHAVERGPPSCLKRSRSINGSADMTPWTQSSSPLSKVGLETTLSLASFLRAKAPIR